MHCVISCSILNEFILTGLYCMNVVFRISEDCSEIHECFFTCCIELWDFLSKYQTDVSTFCDWLFTTVVNTKNNFYSVIVESVD